MSEYYFGGIAMIISMFAVLILASYYAYTIATEKS